MLRIRCSASFLSLYEPASVSLDVLWVYISAAEFLLEARIARSS